MVPFDLGEAYGSTLSRSWIGRGTRPSPSSFPKTTAFLRCSSSDPFRKTIPLFLFQLSDTRYGQVNFEWVIINDPDSERFQIHKDDSTQFHPSGIRVQEYP